MTLTVKPAFGANISSKDWEKFFGKWFPNGVFDGLQVSAGSGLNINISSGTAHVNGYFIESDATESRSVNASTTNYIWCKLIRNASGHVTTWDFQVTTSSTPPSDSILLAIVETSSSEVTSVTDQRNSGMAGISLGTLPATSDSKPYIRVMNLTATNTSPVLEFVKSDGTFANLGIRLISTTTFTSSGTYTPPPDAKFLIVELVGGGGGGGGGGSGGAGYAGYIGNGGGGSGGGGGGSGGWVRAFIFDIASSYTVTIGAGGSGGSGGASATSNGSRGNNGTAGGAGGNTQFYTITANGGSGGNGGNYGGGASTSAGFGGSSVSGGNGGEINIDIFSPAYTVNGSTGGNSGAGGNGGTNGANGSTGYNMFIKSKNITYNGGAGGNGGSSSSNSSGGGGGGGGGGGASGFANGGNGGNGGNGATSSSAATAGANGTNGVFGSGGGGGGGGGGGRTPNIASGAGGNGGNGGSGKVIVWAFG